MRDRRDRIHPDFGREVGTYPAPRAWHPPHRGNERLTRHEAAKAERHALHQALHDIARGADPELRDVI